MTDNYDIVCSCCYSQRIDPAYYICEKCRRKILDLRDKEIIESKALAVKQKGGEVSNERGDAK